MYEILENNCNYSLFLVVKSTIATDKTKNSVINIKYTINIKYNYKRHLIKTKFHILCKFIRTTDPRLLHSLYNINNYL